MSPFIAEIRREICEREKCTASPNFFDPCAVCPNGHWGRYEIDGCIGERIPELPAAGVMLKSAAGAIGEVVRHGAKRVSEEEKERRLAICKACEFFIENSRRCAKCGCFIKWKTLLEAWHCPIAKW